MSTAPAQTRAEKRAAKRAEKRAYRQIQSFVTDNVWAIQESILYTIWQIVTARANGGIRMSEDEVLEAIGGRRAPATQQSAGAVAVVPLRGVLVPHGGMMADVSNPGTGLDSWLEMFNAAVDDPKVATVLLDVDSPGGSAALVTETAAAVRAARSKKQIVAVANTTAASAAYAIACQAETFLVSPSGMVGSIGVYTIHEDMSGALEAEGCKPTIIQAPASGFKTEGNSFGPLSETAQQHLQEMVDSFYATFVADVAAGRGVDAATVEANFGQGRLLTAKAALAAGLVDGVMSLDDALGRLLASKPLTRGGGSSQAALPPGPIAALPAGQPAATSAALAAGLTLVRTLENGGQMVKGADGAYGVIMPFAGGGGGIDDEAVDLAAAAETPDPADEPAADDEPADEPAAGDAGSEHDDDDLVPDEPAETASAAPPPATNDPGGESGQPSSTTPAATAAVRTTNEGGTAMEPGTTTGRPPTLEELAATQDMHRARLGELNQLAAGRLFTADEQSEFDELGNEILLIERTMENLKARATTLAALAGSNAVDTADFSSGAGGSLADKGVQIKAPARIPDNIWDLGSYRKHAGTIDELAARWHDGAHRANELLQYEADDQDRVRGFVERLLKKDPSTNPAESLAHRILLTGNPAYDAAFGKRVMGRQLTQHEEHIVRMAVSETGLGEEMPVPVTIDPTVILTSAGSTNPLRRIARSITITGNKWRGIASDGVEVAYEAELTQVADETPDFVAPEAEVAKAHGWVEFSIEVDQDWGGFRSELTTMFADARDNKEANKFLHGSGVNEPEGLIFALVADGGSIVPTASVGTLALADIEGLTDELPPRFDQAGAWLANKGFYSQVRTLANAENSLDVWLQLSQSPNTPPNLIGYPGYSASEVSKLFTVGGEIVAVLGDYSKFAIIDRIGLNVEVVSIVMGPNGRPKGSRGLYVYFRNTSKLLAPNAFRALEIASS